MKRDFVRLCCGLLLLACHQASAQGDGHSLLWRISGKGLPSDSYLFGTIHLVCPDDYLWTDAMKQTLAASEQVCFELDLNDPGVLQSVSKGLSLAGSDKKLEDYFSKQEWARLSRFMHDSVGMDLNLLQQMKPEALETILATRAVGCSFPSSYESNIMEQAQQSGKEIRGLESAEEQLEVMSSIPSDSLSESIMQTADSFAQARAEYAQMLDAYKRQDLPALYEHIQHSKDDAGMDMNLFLDERNKKWIPEMAQMMQSKSTFFAVGAGHLWGENGVISLLRKAGYSVSPIR
ncbi:MAG: TraB/GumN family protein [Bacteroidetes bacterium]|nr:TraB/GumN family protein [Bacteroidota bacterium]